MKMFLYFITAILYFLLPLSLNAALVSENIQINKSKNSAVCMIADMEALMEETLKRFIWLKKREDKADFKDIYRDGIFVTARPIKSFFSTASFSFTLDPGHNILKFQCRVNIKDYRNYRISENYSVDFTTLVNEIDSSYRITGRALTGYKEFRALLLKILTSNRLKYFISKSKVYIMKGKLLARLNIKKKLPVITGKKNITPEKIKIFTGYKKGEKRKKDILIDIFRNSVASQIDSVKISIVKKKNSAIYTALFKVYPTFKQNLSLSILKDFKSYRTNSAFKLFKKEELLLSENCSKAAVDKIDRKAKIKSASGTGEKAALQILDYIIKDLYRLTE